MPGNRLAVLKDIRQLLYPKERNRFYTLILLNFIVSLADVGSLALLFVVIKFYTPGSRLPMLDHFHQSGYEILPGLGLIFFFALKSLGGYYSNKLLFRFVTHVASRLSEQGLQRYQQIDFQEQVHTDSSVWTRKIIYQPIEFAQYVLSGVQQMFTEIMLILLSVAALVLYNIRLLGIVAVTLLPALFLMTYITRKRLKGIRTNIKTVNEQTLQYLNESLAGYVESNVYGRNELFVQRYAAVQRKLGLYLADLQITQGIPSRFFEVFAVTAMFILIAAMRMLGMGDAADIITIGAFMAAAYKIIPGISRIISLSAQIHTYGYTVTELLEDTATNNPAVAAAKQEIKEIQLENIHFSYNHTSVFAGLHLRIRPGMFIGLTGQSGRGKSTLFNLLLGFLMPAEGQILINGKNESPKAFWHRIAYVKQEPFIIHDTIKNNITLFSEDDGRLNEIISVTGLRDLFPEGINKIISEDGRNISGGQRQRIAIARALFKNADLILLDEPFNELDAASELRLLHHFQQLAQQGKMIVFITHNPKSLEFCNETLHLHANI